MKNYSSNVVCEAKPVFFNTIWLGTLVLAIERGGSNLLFLMRVVCGKCLGDVNHKTLPFLHWSPLRRAHPIPPPGSEIKKFYYLSPTSPPSAVPFWKNSVPGGSQSLWGYFCFFFSPLGGGEKKKKRKQKNFDIQGPSERLGKREIIFIRVGGKKTNPIVLGYHFIEPQNFGVKWLTLLFGQIKKIFALITTSHLDGKERKKALSPRRGKKYGFLFSQDFGFFFYACCAVENPTRHISVLVPAWEAFSRYSVYK